jgi:hypothetical protein
MPAPANHRDDGLLAATLDAIAVVGPLLARSAVHLDAGHDDQPAGRSWPTAGWPVRSPPAGCLRRSRPGAAGVVERTHGWANQYGRLRWCTERRRLVVAFWLALASAVIVCGRLVCRAWTRYRWEGRPARRP